MQIKLIDIVFHSIVMLKSIVSQPEFRSSPFGVPWKGVEQMTE